MIRIQLARTSSETWLSPLLKQRYFLLEEEDIVALLVKVYDSLLDIRTH